MNKRIDLLNTHIDNLSMEETLQLVSDAVRSNKQIHHTVVNAGKIVAMQRDAKLRRSVNEADLINVDGQAVVWASRFLGKPLKERVTGIDLFSNLLQMAQRQNHRVYLLGTRQEVLEKLVEIIERQYGTGIVAGHHHGYFDETEEAEIVREIAQSGANMLFVAMTSPKKEIFLHTHKDALREINFIMGVGGSFDVLSGKTKRAPIWMQKTGLEWLYRVYQEPGRMWKRYLKGNTKFILLVLRERVRF